MSRFLYFTIPILLIIQLSLLAQFAGGSGTEADPWLIRTPQNLDSLRYYLGADNADKYYRQIADIDLGFAPWNVGEGWEPIGTVTDSLFFYGNYNGDGNKINNLTINKPDSFYIGLFGAVHDALLENMTITDVSIIGYVYVGALVGLNWNYNGLISNSYSTGDITALGLAGGIVGGYSYQDIYNSSESLKITNSYSKCNIVASSAMGGMVGSCGLFSSITNSYSTGKVTDIEGNTAFGFTSGTIYNFSSGNYFDIETSECLASNSGDQIIAKGKTTYEMTHYGADIYFNWNFNNTWAEDIFGINDGYPVLQSQLPKNIPDKPDISEIIVNDLEFNVSWVNPSTQRNGDPLTELTEVHITRNGVPINTIVSPIIGASVNFTDSVAEPGYYTYRIYGENSAGIGLLCKTSHIIGQLFSGGSGTETDPYLISNPEDLNNIRYITGYLNNKKYFQQISDIDMNVAPWNSGDYWEPIYFFTDIYDGNNFSIDNLTIIRPEENNLGLFSETEDAIIKNLKFNSAGIIGGNNTGTVAGYAENSEFNNINISVMMTGENNVGGLIGELNTGAIESCSVSGEITGNFLTGGLAGTLNGSISDSYCQNTIYSLSATGGIAGVTEFSTITRSGSNSYIYCTGDCVGGLIGRSRASEISESYSKGYLEGYNFLGGILGEDQENTCLVNCFSFTDVHSSGNELGNILGGLAGYLPFFSDVTNCYSIGKVSNSDNYNNGGLICYFSNSYLYNSYWNIETSGQTTSDGGEGRTTAEMINPDYDSTYVSWDFENIWKIDPLLNGGYPYLKWQNLTGIEEQTGLVPKDFVLSQNYPNPFNPVTKISYSLPQGFSGDVKLSIYNANGQLVKELVNEKKNSGIYSVELNASDLNSGLYIYRLKTENSDISKKMILLK